MRAADRCATRSINDKAMITEARFKVCLNLRRIGSTVMCTLSVMGLRGQRWRLNCIPKNHLEVYIKSKRWWHSKLVTALLANPFFVLHQARLDIQTRFDRQSHALF